MAFRLIGFALVVVTQVQVSAQSSPTPSETPLESPSPLETPFESVEPSFTPMETPTPFETPSESVEPSPIPSLTEEVTATHAVETTSPIDASSTPLRTATPFETPSESVASSPIPSFTEEVTATHAVETTSPTDASSTPLRTSTPFETPSESVASSPFPSFTEEVTATHAAETTSPFATLSSPIPSFTEEVTATHAAETMSPVATLSSPVPSFTEEVAASSTPLQTPTLFETPSETVVPSPIPSLTEEAAATATLIPSITIGATVQTSTPIASSTTIKPSTTVEASPTLAVTIDATVLAQTSTPMPSSTTIKPSTTVESIEASPTLAVTIEATVPAQTSTPMPSSTTIKPSTTVESIEASPTMAVTIEATVPAQASTPMPSSTTIKPSTPIPSATIEATVPAQTSTAVASSTTIKPSTSIESTEASPTSAITIETTAPAQTSTPRASLTVIVSSMKTVTSTATLSATSSMTSTVTRTKSNTPSLTPTASSTPTSTSTSTQTSTGAPTSSVTGSRTASPTSSLSLGASASSTNTRTPTSTRSLSQTLTASPSSTRTPTSSPSSSRTPTASGSSTRTPTGSASATLTPTQTATSSNRPAPSVKPGEEQESGPVAVLDDLGTFLTIEFDVPTNRAGKSGSFNCLDIMYSDIGNIFPEDGCTWANRRTLEIELRSAQEDIDEFNKTVQVGIELTMRGGVIQQSEPSAEMPETKVVVTQPNAPDVEFSVDFNPIVSLCGDVDISVSSAVGATRGEQLTWEWKLNGIVRNNGESIEDDGVASGVREAISQANDNNEDQLLLAEADRPAGASYNVSLKASNDAGNEHTEIILFEVEGVKAPSIDFIQRPRDDTIDVSQDAVFRASSFMEFCENETQASAYSFSFEWSIISPNGDNIPTEGFQSADPRRLNIPRKSLLPFTEPYDIQFNVTASPVEGGEILRSSRDIPLTVNPSKVVARIAGGDRTTGSSTPLTMDASESRSDVEELENIPQAWEIIKNFQWTCEILDDAPESINCADYLLGNDQSTESKPQISVQNLTTLQVDLNNPEELNIRFKVTVTLRLDRDEGGIFQSVDSEEVRIALLQGQVPDIAFLGIQPSDTTVIHIDGTQYFKVNRRDELRLSTSVNEVADEVNIRGWELIEGDVPNLAAIVDGGNIMSPTITILPNTLTRGVRYVLRFSATFTGSAIVGSTEIRLSVNRAPRGGILQMRLRNNILASHPDDSVVSDSDKVLFQARDWRDNDFPLQYEYFYSFSSRFSDSNLLRRRSNSRNLLTTVPTPPDESDRIWIFVRIYDSLGASTLVSRTVYIDEPDADTLDEFAGSQVGAANACVRRADSECAASACREGIRANSAASRRRQNERRRILSSEQSIPQQLVNILEQGLETYVNEEDAAIVYYEALSTAAGSTDLTTDLGEQIIRIVDTVLSKNFKNAGNQFRYSVRLGRVALTSVSRTIAAADNSQSIFNSTEGISAKLSRSVLLNRDPDGSTRTIQASFGDINVFCDQMANIAVFSRVVSTSGDFTISPDSIHGIGLSDNEFENCGSDPEDTAGSARAKPQIAGNEGLINEVSSAIFVVEEFVKLPVVGDEGSAIAQAAADSNTATSLLQSLKDFVENELLPDGNKIGDGLTVNSDRRLRSLRSKNRALAEDVVGDEFSADAFERSISSKPIRVSIYDTDGNSLSPEDGTHFKFTMALYPDSEVNLTRFTSVPDIVKGRESFPSQTFDCPTTEPRTHEITCEDPTSGTPTSVTVTCSDSTAGSRVEFFCATKLLIPVILRYNEETEWTDADINTTATSFTGRTIVGESSKRGLFVSSFLAVDTSHAAKISEAAPASTPGPTATPSPVADSSSKSGFPSYGGVVIGVVVAVLVVAVVGGLVWKRWGKRQHRVRDYDEEAELPIMPSED